ncbi:MAG: LCP family protein [Clostridia bacterium]|nr:LCP family protein [Clostridia bacterium]
MDRKKIIKGIALLIIALIILASLISGFRLVEKIINKSGSVSPDDAFSYSDSDGEIEYGGNLYLPNRNLKSILLLGIDSTENPDEDRSNSAQADFIVLLAVDHRAQSFSALHLNRDTMTDIREIDSNGKKYGEFSGQLALAHTYGSDEAMRCRNTVAVVEELLYGVEIDHYISMTMDAVPIINDSVGGVTLTLLDDFTHVDPTYVKDSVVTLTGSDALTYVRERRALEDSSNLNRMERQKQYVGKLLERVNEVGIDQNDTDLLVELNECVTTDYSAQGITDVVEQLSGYEFKGAYSLEGEAAVGDEFMEFYPDEDAMKKLIVDLFYTPKN